MKVYLPFIKEILPADRRHRHFYLYIVCLYHRCSDFYNVFKVDICWQRDMMYSCCSVLFIFTVLKITNWMN